MPQKNAKETWYKYIYIYTYTYYRFGQNWVQGMPKKLEGEH